MAKTGLTQIYDGTTWRTVEPWIYYGGQWHRAITCLYTTADGWIEFTSTSEPEEPEIIIPTIPEPENGASFAYIVTAIDGAQYGFELNDNGYYESQNGGVHSSYAACRVWFNVVNACDITFDVINYAEASWDFAQFGKLNSPIELNNTQSTKNIHCDFKGKSSPDIVEVVYEDITPGFHFIDIKFIKDGSSHQNNDSVQFKVQESNTGTEEPEEPDIPDVPDTPDVPDVPWVLYDPSVTGEDPINNIEWEMEVFENMGSITVRGGLTKALGYFTFLTHNYATDAIVGNNVATAQTISIPETAEKLKITFNKRVNDLAYAYASVGLISPNETTDSFNAEISISSEGTHLSGETPVTISLPLDEKYRGTNDYRVVVNLWVRCHSGYPNISQGSVILRKVWFE